MLFLMQDYSFDSLGISSVAVCLVDTGNAQMFQPYLYRLADRKCAPVLLLVHSFGSMRLEHCKARSAEIGCVSSFESFSSVQGG